MNKNINVYFPSENIKRSSFSQFHFGSLKGEKIFYYGYLNVLMFQELTVTRHPAVSPLWSAPWLPGGGHEEKLWFLWSHSQATLVSNRFVYVCPYTDRSNGLHLYSTFLVSRPLECFRLHVSIHPFASIHSMWLCILQIDTYSSVAIHMHAFKQRHSKTLQLVSFRGLTTNPAISGQLLDPMSYSSTNMTLLKDCLCLSICVLSSMINQGRRPKSEV